MSFDDLKKNLEQERKIIRDIGYINLQMQNVDEDSKKFYISSLNAFKRQIGILNDAVPDLIGEISFIKKLSPEMRGKPAKTKPKKSIVKLSYVSPSTKEKRFITINKQDKERFIKELSLSEAGLKKLGKIEKQGDVGIKKASRIVRVSNLSFRKVSEKISPKFVGVKEDLKKANIRLTISTYISLALFVSSVIFVFSLLPFVFLSIINFSFLIWLWVPFLLSALSLVCFYFYPALEKGSVQKKISDELPFATIYLAAVAGSNIEPVRVLRIIAMSKEYENVGFEIKKVLYLIDIYGSDLVSALKNSAEKMSNKKLAELFLGLATNIVSGGSLKSYLEKKADNLLLDYKLDRQKATSVAGTFMDIYISILIAAPLVLMMVFIIMDVTNMGIGLSMSAVLTLSIGIVAFINIIFLIVLHIKQPGV